MGFWDELTNNLTRTTLDAAGHAPVVGESIQNYQGSNVQQPHPDLALQQAIPPITKSGVPYLIEIVGPEGQPLDRQEAILFGGWMLPAAMGIAVFIALLALAIYLGWYLMQPEKKLRRRRRPQPRRLT